LLVKKGGGKETEGDDQRQAGEKLSNHLDKGPGELGVDLQRVPVVLPSARLELKRGAGQDQLIEAEDHRLNQWVEKEEEEPDHKREREEKSTDLFLLFEAEPHVRHHPRRANSHG